MSTALANRGVKAPKIAWLPLHSPISVNGGLGMAGRIHRSRRVSDAGPNLFSEDGDATTTAGAAT
jgi:hypothetical protein